MKTFLHKTPTFFKNVRQHHVRLFMGHESIGKSIKAITHDFRKLMRLLLRRNESEGSKRARRYVDKGRLAYNQRRFETAESAFREAILADANCAIAYTYLGHTLYKMGRFREAVVYWGKAIDVAPGSEAANKAQQKILMMQQKRSEANAWIEDRIQE